MCLPSRDMPAQAQALVERMKTTPVSTDPLKGVLPSSWGDVGPDEPLACFQPIFKGLTGALPGTLPPGLAAGGQGGAGSWPRSQALGSLSQGWLPRALLYKHKALKIGCPFQPLPLPSPSESHLHFLLLPCSAAVDCGFWRTPFMVEAEWGAAAPGPSWFSPTILPCRSPSMNPGHKSPDFVPKFCLLTHIPLKKHEDL